MQSPSTHVTASLFLFFLTNPLHSWCSLPWHHKIVLWLRFVKTKPNSNPLNKASSSVILKYQRCPFAWEIRSFPLSPSAPIDWDSPARHPVTVPFLYPRNPWEYYSFGGHLPLSCNLPLTSYAIVYHYTFIQLVCQRRDCIFSKTIPPSLHFHSFT